MFGWRESAPRRQLTGALRHHLYCLLLNDKLFLAPLLNPRRALDVGTGRGLWALYVPFFPLPSDESLTRPSQRFRRSVSRYTGHR
jgi:hypothetical protein